MSYTRFALGFPRHKKIAGLSDAAFRLWSSAMDRSREQLSDGLIDEADLDLVPKCPAIGPKRKALVKELVDRGLWEVLPNGWLIHDYLDWQDSAEQIRARLANARKRMRDVRANIKTNFGGTDDEVRTTYSPPSSDPPSESGLGSAEGVQGEPEVYDDRETMCPSDLLERPVIRSMLRELAEKLRAVPAAVQAEAEDFVGYWTIGKGAGTKRSGWPRQLRERVRKRHQAGELGVPSGRHETAADRRTRDQAERVAMLEHEEAQARKAGAA